MARVELEDTWIAKGDMDTVHVMLRRFFKIHKMRLTGEHPDELQVYQGSQFLTRLIGGWIVPATWLPKRAALFLRPWAAPAEADGGEAAARARPAPRRPDSRTGLSARRLRQPTDPAGPPGAPREFESGVEIQAIIEDAVGFGWIDPLLQNKYRTYFETWLDQLYDFTR
jgi:hypothetical protein